MQIQPYLIYNGRCDEAIDFYRAARGPKWRSSCVSRTAPSPLHTATRKR